jgi:hypothetical protein
MDILLQTNNPVTLSLCEALLKDASIHYLLLDQHTSNIEGSIGAIPRRIMVPSDELERARQLLKDADITD